MTSNMLRGRALKVGAVALTVGATLVAVGVAGPPSGPQLTSVPTADQKAAGYAPAGGDGGHDDAGANQDDEGDRG